MYLIVMVRHFYRTKTYNTGVGKVNTGGIICLEKMRGIGMRYIYSSHSFDIVSVQRPRILFRFVVFEYVCRPKLLVIFQVRIAVITEIVLVHTYIGVTDCANTEISYATAAVT